MKKLSEYEVGKQALVVLQYKMSRSGLDLNPGEFREQVSRYADAIGCTADNILAFTQRFLIPEILTGCNLAPRVQYPDPSPQEALIAFGILRIRFFWDLKGIREEAYNISKKTRLTFEEVAALAIYIAEDHIHRQFGEFRELGLVIGI